MRPAGFEPAITAVSERRVWRIINPMRCQATLRARVWRRSCVRRGRVVVRLRLLGRPRIAPPGFAPGTPGSRPDGIADFPTGLLVAPPRFERGPPRPGRGALAACATGLIAAKTGPRPPDDGGAHTSDVRTSTASRTRFSELWRRYLLEASLTAVGRRIVLPDSAMPCASWESDSRRRPYMEVSARARSPENRLPLNTKGAVCEKGTVTRPLSLRHHRGTRSHFQKVI